MKNYDELVAEFIESGQYIDDNYLDRIVKIHNFHANRLIKISEYLNKKNKMELLLPLLKHPTNYVRLISAYCLLPFFEEQAKEVYSEIINKNIPLSVNAEFSLAQWEENKK